MKRISHYVLAETISDTKNAQFGLVYKAINEKTQQIVAIKQISKSILKDFYSKQLLQREIRNMELCKGKNVVQFIEAMETQDNHYIVMEYCTNGDLQSYINRKKYLQETEATDFLNQLLCGFKTLHQHKVIHRDIKSLNIFMIAGTVKIGDLGFSKQVSLITSTKLGTFLYMAPEMMSKNLYDDRVDLYSLGCIFYEMLFGVPPYYKAKNQYELLEMARNKQYNLYHDNIEIGDQSRQLLVIMLDPDPEQRTWEQVYRIVKDIVKKQSAQQSHDISFQYSFNNNNSISIPQTDRNIHFYQQERVRIKQKSVLSLNTLIWEQEQKYEIGEQNVDDDQYQQMIRQQIKMQEESIQKVRFDFDNIQKKVGFYIFIEQNRLNGDLINDHILRWMFVDKIFRLLTKLVQQIEQKTNILQIQDFKVFIKCYTDQEKDYIERLKQYFKKWQLYYQPIHDQKQKDIMDLLKDEQKRQEVWNIDKFEYYMKDYDCYGQLYFNEFMLEFINCIDGDGKYSHLKFDLLKMLSIDNKFESGSDLLSYYGWSNNVSMIELKDSVSRKLLMLQKALKTS